jgi:hypothetical protein
MGFAEDWYPTLRESVEDRIRTLDANRLPDDWEMRLAPVRQKFIGVRESRRRDRMYGEDKRLAKQRTVKAARREARHISADDADLTLRIGPRRPRYGAAYEVWAEQETVRRDTQNIAVTLLDMRAKGEDIAPLSHVMNPATYVEAKAHADEIGQDVCVYLTQTNGTWAIAFVRTSIGYREWLASAGGIHLTTLRPKQYKYRLLNRF